MICCFKFHIKTGQKCWVLEAKLASAASVEGCRFQHHGERQAATGKTEQIFTEYFIYSDVFDWEEENEEAATNPAGCKPGRC